MLFGLQNIKWTKALVMLVVSSYLCLLWWHRSPVEPTTARLVRRVIPSIETCSSSTARKSEYSFLILRKPQRPFHSHHWYHMGEYYLSQQYHVERLGFNEKRVIVVPTYDLKFNNLLSPTAFFFLVLSLNVSDLQELIVLDPFSIEKQSAKATRMSRRLPFTYRLRSSDSHRYWIFNASQTYQVRFNYVRNQSALFSRLGLSAPIAVCHNASVIGDNSPVYSFRGLTVNSLGQNENTAVMRMGKDPVPSLQWFPSTGHVHKFRTKIDQLCPKGEYSSRGKELNEIHAVTVNEHIDVSFSRTASSQLKLVIYLRDINRKITMFDELYRKLLHYVMVTGSDLQLSERDQRAAKKFGYSQFYSSNMTRKIHVYQGPLWSLWVVHHDEARMPCVLRDVFRDATMLLTVHGFQCMALIFMPEGSLLFEVFPYRYHKPTYENMCRNYGIQYRGMRSSQPSSVSRQLLRPLSEAGCMSSLKCRSYARGDDVDMLPHFETILESMNSFEIRSS